MIKAGQIYKQKNGEIFVVTSVKDRFISHLYNDGYAWTNDCYSGFAASVFWKLLDEYPTWQEAVNSKEFKNNEI